MHESHKEFIFSVLPSTCITEEGAQRSRYDALDHIRLHMDNSQLVATDLKTFYDVKVSLNRLAIVAHLFYSKERVYGTPYAFCRLEIVVRQCIASRQRDMELTSSVISQVE